MKKVIISSLMAMFLVVGLTSMMMPAPPQNTTCGDVCATLVGPGGFSTHGVCMSACNVCWNPSNSAANNAVCLCHQIDDIVGFDNTPYKNMGECVKANK